MSSIPECMLAHVCDFDKITYPCYALPKLDGVRARYFNGKFISRDNKVWNDSIISHIFKTQAYERITKNPTVKTSSYLPEQPDYTLPVDGEFYSHGLKLQEINAAISVKRKEPSSATTNISYFVFDVVDRKRNFTDRYINEIINLQWAGFQVVHPVTCNGQEEILGLHKSLISTGYEGTMIRTGDKGYEPKRSWHLLKLKDFLDGEYIVFDKYEGEGKHQGRLGGVVCLTPEGKSFNVGGGFTDQERELYWHKNITGMIIKVSYQCLSKDLIPRHPNFVMEF